jgi:CHAD domain-containing protein
VRRAGRRPDDRALHRLRILAKQLRYASETAVPVIGRRARRTASAAEGLQSVLGEFHDTVTAEAWLRLQARHDPDGVGPAVAWLVERQRCARRRLRRRWRPAWERLDDPKRRRWL